MIPEFPQFKGLELSDKEEVEKITKKYPPYSDFNFVSMWSWDIKGEMRISLLNGNLVVRFTDYLTGEPFYSFLGNNKVNETAEKLLELSKKEGLELVLKLVPEDSEKGLDTSKFEIKEDRNHFDYIYDLERHKSFDGKKLRNKKNQVGYFMKECPNVEIKVINLEDAEVQSQIIKLFKKWIENKTADNKFITVQHKEIEVIKKIFMIGKTVDLMCIGVYIENELLAFFINELSDSTHTVGLIAKADTSKNGIYAFLRQKNADIIHSFGRKYLNDEQDLGIENLRKSKMQFRPSSFLKKYNITSL